MVPKPTVGCEVTGNKVKGAYINRSFALHEFNTKWLAIPFRHPLYRAIYIFTCCKLNNLLTVTQLACLSDERLSPLQLDV